MLHVPGFSKINQWFTKSKQGKTAAKRLAVAPAKKHNLMHHLKLDTSSPLSSRTLLIHQK